MRCTYYAVSFALLRAGLGAPDTDSDKNSFHSARDMRRRLMIYPGSARRPTAARQVRNVLERFVMLVAHGLHNRQEVFHIYAPLLYRAKVATESRKRVPPMEESTGI